MGHLTKTAVAALIATLCSVSACSAGPTKSTLDKIASCAKTSVEEVSDDLLRECKKAYGVSDSVEVEALIAAHDARHRNMNAEISTLTSDARETQALKAFASAHPDLAERDGMTTYLASFRSAQRRARALEIQFRHQYPNATKEELDILVDDQLGREGEAMFAMPAAGMNSNGIDCTSMRFGQITHTSCY